MNKGALFTATALSAAFTCIVMGLVANYPIASAPTLGLNAFFTYTVCLGMHVKWQTLKGSLAITVIFSIIGSFQLFNEPSILQNMVPGNAITTYYTPNMYAYNLSFTGNQSNYAAALAIVMAIITMAIAYVVQLKSMKEQMK